jgi:hypothetical protein
LNYGLLSKRGGCKNWSPTSTFPQKCRLSCFFVSQAFVPFSHARRDPAAKEEEQEEEKEGEEEEEGGRVETSISNRESECFFLVWRARGSRELGDEMTPSPPSS